VAWPPFSVALGVGFVMQNGDAVANRFAAEDILTNPYHLPPPKRHPVDIVTIIVFRADPC
jgi:hypothetical protein